MKKGFWIFLLAFYCFSTAWAADFIGYKSTYALCTTAKYVPIAGKKDVLCRCEVKTGYSAGQQVCSVVKETDEGQLISSRFIP